MLTCNNVDCEKRGRGCSHVTMLIMKREEERKKEKNGEREEGEGGQRKKGERGRGQERCYIAKYGLISERMIIYSNHSTPPSHTSYPALCNDVDSNYIPITKPGMQTTMCSERTKLGVAQDVDNR